jgi:hypothetical protein
MARFEFKFGIVSFCFSFTFVSFGESHLLVSWCASKPTVSLLLSYLNQFPPPIIVLLFWCRDLAARLPALFFVSSSSGLCNCHRVNAVNCFSVLCKSLQVKPGLILELPD